MTNREDYINIGLMLLSCGLAFILPFELFLFSYAVLGPLHYLTEISWLHQRNYFATGKKDYILLIILCLFISVGVVFHDIFIVRHYFEGSISKENMTMLMKLYSKWFPLLIFSALIGSFGLIIFKKTLPKIILFVFGLVLGYFLSDTTFTSVYIGIFVPTLVHVYVFTALFMLYGAMKNKSMVGYFAVVILLCCGLSFYLIQYVPDGFSVSAYIKDAILKTGFSSVNITAIGLFKSDPVTTFDVFGSRRGLMVQRFIAFAYTYHYLNWFSKTEIIKWLLSSILLWLASMALYYYDYRTGLIALFFISLLHVFLEFPLNIKSILGILEEFKYKLIPKNRIS